MREVVREKVYARKCMRESVCEKVYARKCMRESVCEKLYNGSQVWNFVGAAQRLEL
jgi:hypothetical protein